MSKQPYEWLWERTLSRYMERHYGGAGCRPLVSIVECSVPVDAEVFGVHDEASIVRIFREQLSPHPFPKTFQTSHTSNLLLLLLLLLLLQQQQQQQQQQHHHHQHTRLNQSQTNNRTQSSPTIRKSFKDCTNSQAPSSCTSSTQ